MKFNNVKNIFAPEITEIDLTEKEIEYICMLASGVEKKNVMKILSLNYAKIRDLYNKFGLTNKRMKRDVQTVTLFVVNNFLQKDILLNIYNKYNLIECKELVKLIEMKL